MSKLFFDHLIKIEKLQIQIQRLEVEEDEMIKLEAQVDELIQQRVVEVILDLLHADYHDIFVTYLYENPGNEKILIWLKKYIKDIEERIRETVLVLEKELLVELFEMEDNL